MPIGDIAFDSQYAVGWLMALAVLIVGGAIAAALSAILVGVFVGFYVVMTVFYIYGRSAAEAHGPVVGRQSRAGCTRSRVSSGLTGLRAPSPTRIRHREFRRYIESIESALLNDASNGPL